MSDLNKIKDAAGRLEALAQQMRELHARIVSPYRFAEEEYSLQQAAEALRAALGLDCYFVIKFELEFGHGDTPRQTWGVYTGPGLTWFDGPNLKAAVAAALAREQPGSANPVEQTQAILDAAKPPAPVPF